MERESKEKGRLDEAEEEGRSGEREVALATVGEGVAGGSSKESSVRDSSIVNRGGLAGVEGDSGTEGEEEEEEIEGECDGDGEGEAAQLSSPSAPHERTMMSTLCASEIMSTP